MISYTYPELRLSNILPLPNTFGVTDKTSDGHTVFTFFDSENLLLTIEETPEGVKFNNIRDYFMNRTEAHYDLLTAVQAILNSNGLSIWKSSDGTGMIEQPTVSIEEPMGYVATSQEELAAILLKEVSLQFILIFDTHPDFEKAGAHVIQLNKSHFSYNVKSTPVDNWILNTKNQITRLQESINRVTSFKGN